MAQWPKDNQSALIAFYGDPGKNEVQPQLVPVKPPFRMTYEGQPVKSIMFHRKAATALLAALNEIWDVCGNDQAKLDKLGVSKYSGAFNPRLIRGSKTKWSNHAYGAAIDLNAEANGFNTGHGNMPQFVVDAFKRQGARWGGDYHGRTDPMHFEFCDAGPVAVAPLPEKPKKTPAPQAAVATARTVGVTTAGVTAATQVISAVTGPMSTQVEQVKQVVDVGGQVVDVTKQVVTAVPDGFWQNALAFVQSPKFLALALVVVIISWAATYYLRTHRDQNA